MSGSVTPSATAIMRNPRRFVLEALTRDYADLGGRSRAGLRISPGESKISYNVAVIGVIRERRQLILRAPVNEDGSLIAVMKGQSLTCHWVNATTAFQFRTLIVRILFEPVPLIYIELPPVVDRHTLRGVPRALTNLRALIQAPNDIESVIVDISTGGARVAVYDEVELAKGQEILLLARPRMLHRDFQLSLKCHITGPVNTPDPKHPHVRFYGITFSHLSDNELLILHSLVQECLSMETDTLSQVLLLYSKEAENAV
jgi:c-di-GMP-binding flagellar brake protein YcgR